MALNMALDRDSIIDNYRRRIAEGKRSKLSKPERVALADSFVEMLGYCQSEDDCRVLCEAEIALLEEGYPQGSIANQYLPEWRKAIATAVDDGRLPRQELPPNEFGKIYGHWALKHLLYSNDVYRSLKQQTTRGNNRKQDDLKPVRPDRFIATARRLLTGESPQEWAAGLLALTGRRFSEIVAMGQFWLAEHPYAIAFKGQLKKGVLNIEQSPTFLIATLIDNHEIIDAMERFRRHPRIVALQDLDPDALNSRLSTSVRHHIKREFQDTGLVPILNGEKSVSAHNLRGVYGTIAIRFFCPATQNPHRFVQAHLGHIIGARELASRKNATATEHYFHYVLVGVEGQMLGDRGILLNPFGPLPTAATVPDYSGDDLKDDLGKTLEDDLDEVLEDKPANLREASNIDEPLDAPPITQQIDLLMDSEASKEFDLFSEEYQEHLNRLSVQNKPPETSATQTTMEKSTSSKTSSKKQSGKKVATRPTASPKATTQKTPKKIKAQRRSRTSVPADLMDDLRAIAMTKFDLGADSTNTDVMDATIRFLKDDMSPKMATSIDSLGTTMSWFTTEVDRLRGEVETLETELKAAKSARNQALQDLEQYRHDSPKNDHELAQLAAENQALRGELQQFHQLKQLLGGGNAGASSTPAPVPSLGYSSSQPSGPLSGQTSGQLSGQRSAPQGNSPVMENVGFATVPTPAPAPTPVLQKRVQHEGTALAAIDKAISQIIEWNNNDDRSFDQKWYISVPILQDLLRGSGYTASQPRLKTAMDNRRQDIDEHHATHGLGRRHNTRHQQPITTIMTLE